MDTQNTQQTPPTEQQAKDAALYQKFPELKWLDHVSNLMDNSIPVPFTKRKFGVDALIGLVPNVGDLASFSISGLVIFIITRYGVSLPVMLKMIWNIILDASVGSIPILGDIYDFTFKANRRNMNLLKQHYAEDGHRMNPWLAGGILLTVLIAAFTAMLWAVAKFVGFAWGWFQTMM